MFAFRLTLAGLSPRTRGNLRPATDATSLPGSIPANAGEPLAQA